MVNKLGKAKVTRGKSLYTHKHKASVPKIVMDIIENSDIILEVLDARFIGKSRHIEAEKQSSKLGKTLIYVLNKSDLINKNKLVMEKELESLKPCVILSAKNRSSIKKLKNLIKIEARRLGLDIVNVGIIGYPNTGKSSLINALTRRSSTRTSPEAGHTKGIQKIKLSQGLYLIDTPGIIPPLEKSSQNKAYISKHSQIGAVTWHKVKQPDMVVNEIMAEYPGVLEKHYMIDANGNVDVLIEALGKRLNYLKKRGLVDEIRTAKKILKDWQEGKIRIG